MIECFVSPDDVSIYVSKQDNPDLKFISLEKLGFIGCLSDGPYGGIAEWLLQTTTDKLEDILPKCKDAGVSLVTLSHPWIRFEVPKKIII